MTGHRLDPSPLTTVDVFCRDLPPVLTVDSGDTIVLRSLNASGHLRPQTFPGEQVPTMISNRRGHCLTGPIAVCGMTTELQVELVTDRPVPGVHAQTPAGQITFGFSPDLNTAMGDALDAMLIWLQADHGVDKAMALALASPVLDLRITQVANESWGVHALLPAGAIS